MYMYWENTTRNTVNMCMPESVLHCTEHRFVSLPLLSAFLRMPLPSRSTTCTNNIGQTNCISDNVFMRQGKYMYMYTTEGSH